ncbi:MULTISPECIES: cytochrome P450 [Bradyrhizobium]|uniref:Cytochrome P450 n=3 Tax=Bradyrhizobium TaxID=374 RepID=A0A410VIG9_9BRAD|nr:MULTISPECIES: cytochrome P450 [Bradyrhizobium]MCG2628132.1 cytochrome P450 [Bradyrhizobium zhengyangense]MCG2643251.1 cytochrome P450 [Bradyrhizobium zhengyangense]MCG2670435.1 cytochrome P450 [Bradyrhizobium zhengyangense]MDN4985830.1 cytochrome P450 [Bradyrhizobium sp. WYCCWR 13022]MDN5002791.1 cytochrome P450 [Bradyrhizobium sp. WYCCWR 12677]
MSQFASTRIDPFADEVLRDPYPAYQTFRELGPVFRIEPYDIWAMARYEQVDSTLKDWQTFISGEGVGLKGMNPALPRPMTLQIDPPDHEKGRRILARTMSPGVAKNLRDTFQKEAERKIGELVERGTFDAMTDLAIAYPLKVFPDAIGVSEEGRENLLAWSTFVFNSFGPDNHILARSRDPGLTAQKWIMDRCARSALRPDGIGTMIYEAADAGEITEHEATHLVRPFLTAGVDTTINGLGNTLLALASHPMQFAKLHERPALARNAFEEGLRYDSPVQTFFRTTSREVEMAGDIIPARTKVLVFMASANRDPARWQEPERFDVERPVTGHVGFGSGIHACVGQMIARLEGELVLTELAKRVKSIELIAEPERMLNNTLRGLKSMPVRVTAA